MPTHEDSDLDPQRVERIRTRALVRGGQIRRRTRLVRRSAILAGLAVLAAGGITIAAAEGSPAQHHQSAVGLSSTTTTTAPFTSTTGPPVTTIPGRRLGGTTTTTIPFGTSTTTTIPPATTTTAPPPTSTTIPPPPPSPFRETLQTGKVRAGTLTSQQWTVPSSETAGIEKLTLADTGSGVNGQLRVQLLQPGASPQTLVTVSLGEVATPFGASFTTDVTVPAGSAIAISLACNPDQPACAATLSLSGQLWQGKAPAADESSSLEDVVTPGMLGSARWTVPAGDTFSLTDLLLSALGPSTGQVRVEVLQAGAPPRTIVSYQLDTLGRRPVYDGVSPPLTLTAGEQLAFTVSCDARQAACMATTLFAGSLAAAR